MVNCCVPKCSIRTKKGIILKKFPQEGHSREIWLRNISRLNWEPTCHSAVCEKHFDVNMWEKQRVDGKRKLKASAYPTLFLQVCNESKDPNKCADLQKTPNSHSGTAATEDPSLEITVDNLLNEAGSTAKSWGKEPACSDSVISGESISQLKAKLRESEEKLHRANAMIKRELKSKQALKMKNENLKKKLARATKRNKSKLEQSLTKVLNDDQLDSLVTGSTKGKKWSAETLKKGMRLKIACGSIGYKELRKQNFPLPGERTLRRKLGKVEFKEGDFDDIFELLKQKTSSFRDRRKLDCTLALEEAKLTPGQQLDSTNSMCGTSFFPNKKEEKR